MAKFLAFSLLSLGFFTFFLFVFFPRKNNSMGNFSLMPEPISGLNTDSKPISGLNTDSEPISGLNSDTDSEPEPISVPMLRGLRILSSSNIDLPSSNYTFQCKDDSDCSGSSHGHCIRTKECVCSDFYITAPSDNPFQCNYRLKSLQTTLTAQILMPGAGQMWIGNYIRGSIQFVFGTIVLGIFILIALLSCFSGQYSPTGHGEFGWLITICFIAASLCCGIIIWSWVDAGLLNAGFFLDGNGHPLYYDT
jgi:hypothetical protein